MSVGRRAGRGAWYLMPAGLTVYLSFNAGGFFIHTTAVAAVAVTLALLLRTTLTESPWAGLSRAVRVAAGALALLAAWTLASASWSNAPARAIGEFDRTLLYMLVLTLVASVPRTRTSLGWTLRGLALGLLVICTVALATRLAPDTFGVELVLAPERLSYPLSYWNGLGLLAAVGAILSFHLSSSLGEPRAVRVLGAAALPAFATALFFTFSRGAIAVGVVGLAAYVALARPRGILGSLLATGPATAVAIAVAYSADQLASREPTGPTAVDQGQDVAVALVLCALAAATVRTLLLWLDDRLGRVQFSAPAWRPLALSGCAVVLAGAIWGAAALDAPAYVSEQYERFVEGTVIDKEDPRERLFDPANNRRLDHWRVAADAFKEERLRGHGAGTYVLLWEELRPSRFDVLDAHSLALELPAELGLVGAALLAVALVAMAVGFSLAIRGRLRAQHAAVAAVALAWLLHASIDWDWEMPATTLWLFALAGAALATPADRAKETPPPSRWTRVIVGLALLALALAPAGMALSQHHLDRSLDAFKRGDCAGAVDSALASLSAVPARPEPWELIGYCDARTGRGRLAVRALQNAVERDPHNWEFHYGLALVRGVSGLDPRPAARAALRRNPLEPLAKAAVRRFRGDHPQAWAREARRSPLHVP